MTTDKLSEIANWQSCGANVPAGYDVEAVVESVTDGWSRECVEATVQDGVADEDAVTMADIIAAHDLTCTVEQCSAALLDHCRAILGRDED